MSFIVLFYIVSRYIEPAPKKELSIATGTKIGNYYKIALQYKELLKKQGVTLNIVNTSGSIENLKLLNEKKVDIGFVQGGIINKDNTNKDLSSLASVYYEPLWVFYKNNGYTINYLIELIGKRVAIGIEGSGTKALSMEILNKNGVNSENTDFLYLTTNEAKEQLIDGKIDAMFTVISPKSAAIKTLLSNPTINLLSLKRVKAYQQQYQFLSSVTLYEGTMDMYKNIPSQDKQILATTANLVCNSNLNNELVRLFLKQTKKIHSGQNIFENEDQFPSLNNLDIGAHKEAMNYLTKGDSWLESIFPFWIASNIDRLKLLIIPLLTLLFPLTKGIFPIYRWTIRYKIYKWYDKLDNIQSKEELNELKIEIKKQTKVPSAYRGEYYNLLLHVDLIRKEYIKIK